MTPRDNNDVSAHSGSQRETPEAERPGIFAPPNGDGRARTA